jgi:hypothetical protein
MLDSSSEVARCGSDCTYELLRCDLVSRFFLWQFLFTILSLCWTLGVNGSTARGSAKRDLLKQKTGKFQVHTLVTFLVRCWFQPRFEKEIACEYQSVKRLFGESHEAQIQ